VAVARRAKRRDAREWIPLPPSRRQVGKVHAGGRARATLAACRPLMRPSRQTRLRLTSTLHLSYFESRSPLADADLVEGPGVPARRVRLGPPRP
jgi:hypothetical protein